MRLFLFLFIWLGLPVMALAAEINIDQSTPLFSLVPAKIEATLKPGEKIIKSVTVVNTLGHDANFVISVEDIGASDNIHEPAALYGEKNGPYSIRQLVRVPYTAVFLKDGESASVPIEIVVPPAIGLGGRYGVVLFSVSSLQNINGEAAKMVSRAGALLLVKVDGPVTELGEVVSFGVIGSSWRFYDSAKPLVAQVTFKNSGNIHLNTYGIVVAKNIFGQEVAVRELDPWFVLPGGTRLREISFANDLSFGRYKLEAKINRGYNNQIDERTAVVWVLPRPWISVLIVVVLAGVGAWWLAKSRRKSYD